MAGPNVVGPDVAPSNDARTDFRVRFNSIRTEDTGMVYLDPGETQAGTFYGPSFLFTVEELGFRCEGARHQARRIEGDLVMEEYFSSSIDGSFGQHLGTLHYFRYESGDNGPASVQYEAAPIADCAVLVTTETLHFTAVGTRASDPGIIPQ
jgi:hypothetical protein